MKDDDAIVRVNMKNLRKRLNSYYLDEGEDDPTVIRFQAHTGFTPTVTANSLSSVFVEYEFGMLQLLEESHLRSRKPQPYLKSVSNKHPI